MGGRVLFALSIAAFPEELPRDVLAAVFDGAAAKVREAGGTLAGGHTIRDPEPKYGLAVIGAAHPDRLLRKGGARPGDALLLTKRARDRPARQRRPPGPDDRRRPRRARSTRCGRSTAPPREVLVAPRDRAARPTSRASACSATASRWRGRPGRGSSSTPRRCRRCQGALDLARAGRRDRRRGPQPPLRSRRPRSGRERGR